MAWDLQKAVKDKVVKIQDVIGQHGVREPRVCVCSGRPSRAPYVTQALGGGFYCRINAEHYRLWGETYRKAVEALVNAPASKTKTEVKS